MPSTLLELMRLGGPIMWVILGASIVAVAVFAERILEYRRMGVPLDPFLDGIASLVKEKKEALERCDEAHGPAIRVIQAGLLKRDIPLADLRESLQEVAQLQVPRLEKNLSILATVGYISPLLGLLGTVTGMIHVFQTISGAKGTVPVGELAGGVWEALLTTAGGLVVAIPAYVAYNYLASRMAGEVNDMERAGIEMIQILKEGGRVASSASVSTPVTTELRSEKPKP
ncbi:MAG: MotA/TolQ/ExbB proton channel family protein [Verrucomicrobia bacterium]|nr:MotA/TolQ/ExbB proton channel family protein [Verrucomicrobiota bacterium]